MAKELEIKYIELSEIIPYERNPRKNDKAVDVVAKSIKELAGDRELVSTNYYVAPLDIKADEEKYWAHQRFLNKLRQIPKFEVVLCTLKKLKADGGKYVYVVKGDDVKMSNALLMGAVDNLYDTAIVISGDEDFIDSINIVRKRYKKKIGNAYFSKSSSSNLRNACDFTINLDKILDKIVDKK
ncbi:NYN domain-containing protein [Candidatus Pacearchaeota archaeon]|nr:NYN domain-containing protein [Candidatus Pacearchaeota archaeon]